MRLRMGVVGRPGRFADAMAGELDVKIRAAHNRMARIHHQALKTVGDRNKEALRQDVAAGGFHKAAVLAKTWQGRLYPSRPVSLEPAYQIKSKAAVIIDAFTDGVTIRAADGHFLAIPLPPAKAVLRKARRDRQRSRRAGGYGRDDLGRYASTGSEVQIVAQSIGQELVPVIDPQTNEGVLVAVGRTRFTPTGREAKRQNGQGTPMFALVRQATLGPRIQGRKLIEKMNQTAHAEVVAEIARLSAGSED